MVNTLRQTEQSTICTMYICGNYAEKFLPKCSVSLNTDKTFNVERTKVMRMIKFVEPCDLVQR